MNIHQKIIEVRKCVDYLQKDTKGYNYKYVSEDAVLGKIKDKMTELGLLLIPQTVPGTMQITLNNYEKKKYDHKRGQSYAETVNEVIVSCEMVFKWVDAESGETLEVPFVLWGQMDDASQAFGSGLTYVNRYFLLKFFNIATNELDPDKWRGEQKENAKNADSSHQKSSKGKATTATQKQPKKEDAEQRATKEQVFEILELAKQKKVDIPNYDFKKDIENLAETGKISKAAPFGDKEGTIINWTVKDYEFLKSQLELPF